jgi:hypothetical protein
METSLHRQLKAHYAGQRARQEVSCAGYRIDAVRRGRLIEIQHGSLAAIRDKIAELLSEHAVTVVKPIIATKRLVQLDRLGGREISRRLSPKRGELLHLFEELVYFTKVFPHPRLTLEIVLVEVEELRYPGHGKRRRWRERDFQIADQTLVGIVEARRFRTRADLRRLLPRDLPTTFHTGHLATLLKIQRGFAQKIAYCLREIGGTRIVGKEGNSLLYQFAGRAA